MSSLLNLLGGDTRGDTADAMTTREFAEKVGKSTHWVLKKIRELSKKGLVEVVMIRTTDITGRTASVPAYRLKGGADAVKAE